MRIAPLAVLLPLTLAACSSDDASDKATDTAGAAQDAPEPTDADGDGFAEADDCDDTNAAINPDATEVCDGIDNDCNDWIDDDDPGVTGGEVFYFDYDGDGFGDNSFTETACEAPENYVADNTDCNDAVAAINPDATEICDDANADENCNGVADDEDETVDDASKLAFYADADLDGFASVDPTMQCDQGDLMTEGTDCNDADAAAYPGADEWCDGVQTDCSTAWSADTEPAITFTNAIGERSNLAGFPDPFDDDGIYEVCGSDLAITGGDAGLMTIRGMTPTASLSTSESLETVATISLSDLAVTVQSGGEWYNSGDLTIENVSVNGLSGGLGAGFYYGTGDLYAANVDFSGNIAGGFTVSGIMTIEGMTYDSTGTGFNIVPLSWGGSATLTDVTDTTDYTALGVLGYIISDGDATITNLTTSALFYLDGGNANVEESALIDGWVGLIVSAGGTVTLSNSEVSGHATDTLGVGALTIEDTSTIRLINSVVDDNETDVQYGYGDAALDLDSLEDASGTLVDVTCTSDGCANTAP